MIIYNNLYPTSSDKINNRSFHVIRGLLSAVENGKSDRPDHRMENIRPNSAWGSLETKTIGKTRPTLPFPVAFMIPLSYL